MLWEHPIGQTFKISQRTQFGVRSSFLLSLEIGEERIWALVTIFQNIQKLQKLPRFQKQNIFLFRNNVCRSRKQVLVSTPKALYPWWTEKALKKIAKSWCCLSFALMTSKLKIPMQGHQSGWSTWIPARLLLYEKKPGLNLCGLKFSKSCLLNGPTMDRR